MTTKTLAQRLIEQARGQRGTARAVILALQDEIAEARQEHWPLKTIWETLHDEGRIRFGYATFRRILQQVGARNVGLPARGGGARYTEADILIALRAEIEAARSKGWSCRAVWRELRDEGAIRMPYSEFERHVSAWARRNVH